MHLVLFANGISLGSSDNPAWAQFLQQINQMSAVSKTPFILRCRGFHVRVYSIGTLPHHCSLGNDHFSSVAAACPLFPKVAEMTSGIWMIILRSRTLRMSRAMPMSPNSKNPSGILKKSTNENHNDLNGT